MVLVDLPPVIPNFDGLISHIVPAGSGESLVFVAPQSGKSARARIAERLQTLGDSLRKIASYSAIKSGGIYIAKVDGLLERISVIRRPTPMSFQVYFIDQGLQSLVNGGTIFEMPIEMLQCDFFDCMCPVRVPSAKQLKVCNDFVGRKCRCIVDTVHKSQVVVGYVRGKLLIEKGNEYLDLKSVLEDKSVNYNTHYFNKRVGKNLSVHDGAFQERNERGSQSSDLMNETSESESSDRCLSTEDRYNFFRHTAFKQYVPDEVPVTVKCRFDKKIEASDTFFVVNEKCFTQVEKVLKENFEKLMDMPLLNYEGEVKMKHTPCLAYTITDSARKAFRRAVPATYDSSARRYSVFLVDYGWFKWVTTDDIIDISSIERSNPIRNLPVALIHCKEDSASSINAKELLKGTSCNLVIKEFSPNFTYMAELHEIVIDIARVIGGTFAEQDADDARVDRNHHPEGFCMGNSCRKIDEADQHQVIPSVVTETMNDADQEMTFCHYQNFWQSFGNRPTAPMPLVMPMLTIIPSPDHPAICPRIGGDRINQCNANTVWRKDFYEDRSTRENNHSDCTRPPHWNAINGRNHWNRYNENDQCSQYRTKDSNDSNNFDKDAWDVNSTPEWVHPTRFWET